MIFLPALTPDTTADQMLVVNNLGTIPFLYSLNIQAVEGEVCKHIDFIAERDDTIYYASKLTKFEKIVQEPIDQFHVWTFYAGLHDVSPKNQNKTCSFEYVFEAKQNEAGGYTDQKTLATTIHTGSWQTGRDYKAKPRDVIINEVMWMGSTVNPYDEWIELLNTTEHDIAIGGWRILNGSSVHEALTLPDNTVIPPFGLYLISHYNSTDARSGLNVLPDFVEPGLHLLNEMNGDLYLVDMSSTVIDQVSGNVWPNGENTKKKQSMQRNEIPGNGLLYGNWKKYLSVVCNSAIYWDREGNNYGTPKGINF